MKTKTYVGVDIGGTNIKAALVKNGRVEKRVKIPSNAHLSFVKSLAQIKTAIKPLVLSSSGIGIGIAGIIDSQNGVVKFSPNLKGWQDVKLAAILKREFNKPVKILNDVNAICLGEWKYGAARGYDNVFLFTLGTGVGGAAICEGKPLFGAFGFAGEFGHTSIDHAGPKCCCGNYGCLERYVGARYIVARAKRKIKNGKSALRKYDCLTPKTIAREAKSNDRVAKEVFAEIGYYIGVAVANIIALFDPEVIIISGAIARAGKTLFEPIRQTVTTRLLGARYRKYKIIPARLDDDAGILGAVYYASISKLRCG